MKIKLSLTGKKVLTFKWTVKKCLLYTVGLPNSEIPCQKVPENKLRKGLSQKGTNFSILSPQAEK